MKKHYIFDLDDTLTNSYKSNQDLFVTVFEKILNINDPDVDKYLRQLHYEHKGESMYTQFEAAKIYFKLDSPVDDLIKLNEQIQLKNASNMQLFESVLKLIKTLKKQGKVITICSNRQYSSLIRIIEYTGIDKHINNVISCSDEGHEKPDPYCIEKIITDNKHKKSSCLYLGDSQTDKLFAEKAGIDYLIIDHYLNNNKFYKILMDAFIG